MLPTVGRKESTENGHKTERNMMTEMRDVLNSVKEMQSMIHKN